MNMSRFRRALSAALCVLLLLTSFPVGTLGEGADEGASTPVATASAQPTAVATAEAAPAPAAEPTPVATAAAEPTPVATAAAEPTPTATATAESTPTATATAETAPTATATAETAPTATAAEPKPTATVESTPTATAPEAAVIARFLETPLSLEIEYGTLETDIGLPLTLPVEFAGGAQGEVEVAWDCVSDGIGGTVYVPMHERQTEVVYTFQARLTGGELLADGVALPAATVRYFLPQIMLASNGDYSVVDGELTITGVVHLENVSEEYTQIIVYEGGQIIGGETSAQVNNVGTISEGTFSGLVTNLGTISDGTFSGSVTNRGQIIQGTFTGDVSNRGTIAGGEFPHFKLSDGEISITKSADLSDGADELLGIELSGNQYVTLLTINSGVSFHAGSDTVGVPVTNNGTISGGTFGNAVTNSGGTIAEGTFNAKVKSNANATISGGTFHEEVLSGDNAKITGGTFNGAVRNAATIQGANGNVPTINGEITQYDNGSILQPCNFGESASVNPEYSKGIQVVMEVDGQDVYFNYGENICDVLNEKFGVHSWLRVDSSSTEEVVGKADTFGLQKRIYKSSTIYQVVEAEDLSDVNLSQYTGIEVRPGGDLNTTLEINLPVTNRGTISGGTFKGAVTNCAGGKITGGDFTAANVTDDGGTIIGGTFKHFYFADEGGYLYLYITSDVDMTDSAGAAKLLGVDLASEDIFMICLDGVTFNGGGHNVGRPFRNDGGTIAGGTFSNYVRNHQGGKITGGVFEYSVENARGAVTFGTITGGTFNGIVRNFGEIQGNDRETAPTIGGTIDNQQGGSVLQPCNFGPGAQASGDNAGEIQVVMEINGQEGFFNYGQNILSALEQYETGGSREWLLVNADESQTPVAQDDTFGLLRQKYVFSSIYYVEGEDDLSSFNASQYTYIVVKEGAVLNPGDSSQKAVHLPVTNNGTIQSGSYFGAVTNNGAITGGTFGALVTNNGTISGGTFNGAVNNSAKIQGEGGRVPALNGVIAQNASGSI